MVAARFGERPHVVSDEWPVSQCWAYAAWIVENDPVSPPDRVSDGYIAQERLK